MLDSNPLLMVISKDAMACPFEVLVHPGEPENGPEIACHALDTISYLEQVWSVYQPTSELSLINARGFEQSVEVSSSTIQLLELAKDVWKQTDGAFDITANRLTKAWGFFRRQGKIPTAEEISQSLDKVGSQYIDINSSDKTVRLLREVELNSGGIGKGLAIDMACQSLEDAGIASYAMHGGKSSIRCRGSESRSPAKSQGAVNSGWHVSVRHPFQTERMLGTLMLMDQSLGTSGPAQQYFYFGGKRYGHIINPKTGWPVDGILSMTVLHPSAGWADALATGLYVAGIEAAEAYCKTHPDTSILAILPGTRDGEVEIVTCNLQPQQWRPSASPS
jgi:FAD:protein FMN transferase